MVMFSQHWNHSETLFFFAFDSCHPLDVQGRKQISKKLSLSLIPLSGTNQKSFYSINFPLKLQPTVRSKV